MKDKKKEEEGGRRKGQGKKSQKEKQSIQKSYNQQITMKSKQRKVCTIQVK